MSKTKGASQLLLTEQKPTFSENEFTVSKPIGELLRKLVVRAREIEVNKKQLVNTVAFEIEEELIKMNRPELTCHISEVMLGALRRNKVKWSIAYLRRVLPEKYKDPIKSNSAKSRFQKSDVPGIAPDTGLSAEELEESLNRKPSGWGTEYVVKQTLECKDKEELKAFFNFLGHYTQLVKAGGANVDVKIPLIVTAMPNKQEVSVKIDIEECKKLIVPKRKPKVSKVKPQTEKIIGDVINNTFGDLFTGKPL